MDSKIMLNHRQISWITCVLMTAGGLVSLPKALVAAAEQDAWMLELGGALYGLLICALFGFLSRRFPGKNLFEIAHIVAGRWGGHLINLVTLVYLWLIMVRATRGFVDFLNSTLLQRTPEEISIYIFTVVLIYYGVSSIEVTSRVGDFVIPTFVIFMLTIPFLLANEFSLERLEPMMSTGLSVIAKGNLLPMGWYSDVVVLGAFLHTLRNGREMHFSLRHGVMLATVTLSVVLFTVIAVLGTSIGQRSMYPAYLLVEQVHITDYLDRIELMMFSIWLPAYLIKCSVMFVAFQHCLSSFGSKNARNALFAKQTGWFFIITTFLAFRNVTEVFNFGNYGSILHTAVLQVPCLLAIYLLARRKKFDYVDPEQEAFNKLDRKRLKSKKHQKWRDRLMNIPPHTWFWSTNGLMALAAGCLVGGQLLGQDVPLAGRFAAAFYMAALIGAWFTTIMEMQSKKMRLALIQAEQQPSDSKSA